MSEALVTESASTPTNVDLGAVIELLRAHDNILVVSHMRPDGDCLGSTLGLLLVLRALGKRVAGYNASPLGKKWNFVPEIGLVENKLPNWPISLTVFVDCGAVSRVSEDFVPHGHTINIDHHLTNERFADFNWIDVDACAVGEQIHAVALALGVPITREIATALYLSIMTDTGGFRYSNTSARAFSIAGELVACGADPGSIAQAIYENRTRGEVALSAIAMQRLNYEFNGAAVWTELRWDDYRSFGGAEAEPEGLVGEMRAIEGVEVSMLMHESEEGFLRVGFRGKGRIDCSAIAAACGGGGHYNASGANIKRPFLEAREIVLANFRKGVKKDLG